MENTQIDVEKLMKELKKKAEERQYSKEAADFDMVLDADCDSVRSFYLDDFKDELREGHQECYIEYDLPLEGKGKSIKKMIRKFYRFHMKPLWDRQNDVNVEVYSLLNQIKNYISQVETEKAQKDQKIARLEKLCDEYDKRLHKLEELLKEEKQV